MMGSKCLYFKIYIMLIYLIGYMGCGKTTIGKKLATQLNYSFLDLDDVIEQNQKKSIAEIFEKDGQNTFREIEKNNLHNTFNLKNTIISTGGGAPCFFDNMEQMNRYGTTIYIKLSPKALTKRLSNLRSSRPLIKEKTDEELFNFIEKMLSERELFYNKSLIKVNGIGLHTNRIIKAIDNFKNIS